MSAAGLQLEVLSKAMHRNGVGGAPFSVALVRDTSDGADRTMVVVMFDEPGHTAVLDVDLTAAGDIAFGSNSWRGDHYEGELRSTLRPDEDAPYDPSEWARDNRGEQEIAAWARKQ